MSYSCPRSSWGNTLLRAVLRRQSSTTTCPFCALDRVGPLLHEDALVAAFADQRPRAHHHVLVVPREHIASSRELRVGHAPHAALLRHMIRVGEVLLLTDNGTSAAAPAAPAIPSTAPAEAATAEAAAAKAAAADCLFGFHVPPWNSVPHLHMHCLRPPFTPAWERLRFLPGLGTFEEARQLLHRLDGDEACSAKTGDGWETIN